MRQLLVDKTTKYSYMKCRCNTQTEKGKKMEIMAIMAAIIIGTVVVMLPFTLIEKY